MNNKPCIRFATRFLGPNLVFILLGFIYSASALALSPETLSALDEERYEAASTLLERALGENPNDAELQAALAEAYWRGGRLKKAQDAVEALLELRQDHANDYYLQGRILSERVNEVSVFKKLSYAGQIREAFEHCLKLDPAHVKAMLALVIYHIAAPGIAGGDRDRAEELAQSLHGINEVAAMRAEMMLLFDAEKIAEAHTKAEQLLMLKPGDVSTLSYLTILEINQEHYAEAMEYARQAQQADDLDQRQQLRGIWYLMGKAASESGQWLDEGKTALERYVALNNFHSIPPKAWAYFRLGQIYQHLNNEMQALHYLQLAEQENKSEDDDDLKDKLKAERKKHRAG